jgi:hypothetical protein
MEIGATDPASQYLDQHLAGLRCWHGQLFELQWLAWAMEHHGLHVGWQIR